MARRVAELALHTDGALLCVKGYDEGVHLGEALGLVRTEVDAGDAQAPTDGPPSEMAVAALRAMFVETGQLLATGPHLDPPRRAGLRDLFESDPARASIEFARLGLRWRTADPKRIAFLEPKGDVLKTEVTAFALSVEAQTAIVGTSAQWVPVEELWSSWSRGEELVSPTCAEAVRRLKTGRADSLPVDGHRPRAWAVAPHLQMLPVKTPTLPPATHTNVFLVGTGSAVLVEPASPYEEELDRIEAWVADAHSVGTKLQAIVATHHHIDHIGGATALSDRLGLPLWAHAMTQERLEGLVTFDRILHDGERLELDGPVPTALTAMHTPGHAPGHLCFVDETSGIMIAGDMVAGVGTILVEPNDGDMSLYLDSLRTMARAEPTALLPAHGGVIRNPQQMLEFYVTHRLMRETKVLDSLSTARPGAKALELLPTAYDDAPKTVWPLAEQSVEAHLIKLERDGKVRRVGEGWAVA